MERTGLSGGLTWWAIRLLRAQHAASAGGNKVWFTNPAAFSPHRADGDPASYGPGTSGRNISTGRDSSTSTWVSKKMKITERINAELRVEGYNIFNHPHFNNPGSDQARHGNRVGSPIFGLITSTVTRPDATTSARQMQVALKVNF